MNARQRALMSPNSDRGKTKRHSTGQTARRDTKAGFTRQRSRVKPTQHLIRWAFRLDGDWRKQISPPSRVKIIKRSTAAFPSKGWTTLKCALMCSRRLWSRTRWRHVLQTSHTLASPRARRFPPQRRSSKRGMKSGNATPPLGFVFRSLSCEASLSHWCSSIFIAEPFIDKIDTMLSIKRLINIMNRNTWSEYASSILFLLISSV